MSLKRKAGDLATDAAKKPKSSNAAITSFFGQPKSSPTTSANSSQTLPSSPAKSFDKKAWIATLTEDQRQLLKLEIGTLHESWLAELQKELISKDFLDLKRFLASEVTSGKKVFPPSQDVYAWSRHTPLNNVRAVILGQDPYHGENQAHGLCFSVRPPTKAPPSLKNMYTALANDYPTFTPPPNGGGLLTPWADSGVLLLNTCLTVRAAEANSHAKKGWEQFTQRVIDLVAAKRTRGVVFLAWGKPAQSRCKGVNKSKHLVLESVHPSPLSAHKGFMECGHFKAANGWLEQRYGPEGKIEWDLNVKPADVQPDDVKPVIVTPNEVKPEEAQPENVASESVEPATVEAENVDHADDKPAKVGAEDAQPEDAKPVDVESEGVKPVDASPEDVKAGSVGV